MRMNADWPHAGALRWTLFTVFSLLHRIFSRERAERSQSHQGIVLRLNSAGYLVRDDRLPLTNSVPTVVVRRPE